MLSLGLNHERPKASSLVEHSDLGYVGIGALAIAQKGWIMSRDDVAICRKCKYFEEYNSVNIWHHQYCLAPPQNKAKMNYTTGVPDKPETIYCRDRNPDGNCKYYKRIESWWL